MTTNRNLSRNGLHSRAMLMTEMVNSIAFAVCCGIVVVVAAPNANGAKSSPHFPANITDSSELELQLLLTFNSVTLIELIETKDEQRKSDWKTFTKAMLKFRRWYNTEDELMRRFKAFQRNMRLGEKLKENDLGSATYGVTEFFDVTSEEFMALRGIGSTPSRQLPRPTAAVHHQPQHKVTKQDAAKKDKKKIKTFMHLF